MPISQVLAKDFVMELQVYVYGILKGQFGASKSHDEMLDITNDIVDYCFGLMLKTHTGEQLRFKFDDDIPF